MTWVVDGRTFARKVKNPTHPVSKHGRNGQSMECPSCGCVVDQSNSISEWPGLPAGVKFDPSDQELLDHLAAKVGLIVAKPHPFIDEFIPTLHGEDGICYTHPEKLPGIRCDGSSIHFFHRPARAYTTGTRKRRKVQLSEDSASAGEVRWHKTGKTRPVIENGKQLGCKKIMVLYVSFGKKSKPDKTNWVMHQYHLGVQEEEREGELVVSKIFYQTQPRQSVAIRKGEEEGLEAIVELGAEPAHSFPHSVSSIVTTTSISSHGTPSTPRTPVSFGKQHRGLLGVISEDVDRLNASLLGNSIMTGQSSEQCALSSVGFISTAVDCLEKENQRSTFEPVQGSPDTGCSLEATDILKDYQTSDPIESLTGILLSQPALRLKGNREAIKGIGASQDEDLAYKVDSALDNIILDTPPDFMMSYLQEPLLNSQEAQELFGKKKFWSDSQEGLEWLEKKKLSDSQKTNVSDDCNFLDFIRGDSQSNLHS